MSRFKVILSKWRNFASDSLTLSSKQSDKIGGKDDYLAAKTFNEIPGPKAFPVVGNTFRFLSILGQLDKNNIQKMLHQLNNRYGDIVRLEGVPFKKPIVFLFSPELVEEMHNKEGEIPSRQGIDCFEHYIEGKKKHSLSTSQGKEWKSLRSKVGQVLLNRSCLTTYLPKIDNVTYEFIQKMRDMKNVKSHELPDDFMNELCKLALETICVITLDCRLGCLDKNLSNNNEAQQMIHATRQMFELMYELEKVPLHKFFPNAPQVRRFVHIIDVVNGIAEKYVNDAKKQLDKKLRSRLQNKKFNPSMLERMIMKSVEEAAPIVAQDMIVGGVDTIANTVGKTLYLLATNPEAQDKLFIELQSALPNIDSVFTEQTLDKIPYLRACMKETMRIFPPLPGNTRTMQKETIIGGFSIPEKVNVFAAHSIMGHQPEYFPDPEKFIPERWLRGDTNGIKSAYDVHPYAVLPYGFGTRSCVARYLANYEMAVFIAKIVRAFKLDWQYGSLEIQHHLMNTVKSPLKLKITDRS